MAVELATAYVSIVPSFKGAQRQLSQGLGAPADAAGRDAGQKFGSSFSNIAKKVIIGAAIYKGVSAAASVAKEAVFGFNSQLQNSTIAFTTMLGSGQKAKVFLDQLQSFAKSTPFEFSSLVQNTQTMMGMGIAAKDVIPDLTALGDSVASVGGGADVLNNTISAFSQTMAKGTLDMGNMNQLLEGGMPSALKILAASYHVTTGQMVKMISAGKVQSSDALPRLVKGLEQGTSATAALGGMMDKQSATFSGALGNISDSFTQTAAGAFKPFFNLATRQLQNFARLLGSPAVAEFGAKVSSSMSAAFNAVGKFNFAAVLTKLKPIAQVVMTRVLIPAFRTLKDVLPKIGQAFRNVFAVLVPLWKSGFTPLSMVLKLVWPAIRGIGTALVAVTGVMKDHKVLVGALVVTIGTAVAVWQAWKLAVAAWAVVTKVAAAVQLAFNTVMDANPIVLVTVAIAALAAGMVYAYQHSETFRNIVQSVFAVISRAVKIMGAAFTWVWDHVIHPVYENVKTGINGVSTVVGAVATTISTAFRGIATGLQWVWDHVLNPIYENVKAGLQGVWDFVSPIITFISDGFKTVGDGLQWAYDHVIKPIFDTIKATISTISDAISSLNPFGDIDWNKLRAQLPTADPPKKKALGGPVKAHTPYIVGERRPELFVPDQSGTIVPRVPDGFGGGKSVTVNQTNYFTNGAASPSTPDLLRRAAGVFA